MTVTAAQIRAGRGLVHWTAKDLADRIGITPSSMSAIENEQSKGSVQTLLSIEAALTGAGVEFTGNDGVRKRQAVILELQGTEGFRTLMDMVYESARDHGGEICLFNGSPNLFIKWLGEDWYNKHAARMRDIKDNFSFKVAIKEGELRLIGNSFVEYRWIPATLFRDKTIYIFGNKVAFLGFDDNSVRIQVIDQLELSESMRVLFSIAWEHVAQKIETTS